MKVAIWVHIWGRHEIADQALKSIEQFCNYAPFEVIPVYCVSNTEDLLYVKRTALRGRIVWHENTPLSAKHRFLIRYIREEFNPDYYLQWGSDNVINQEGFDHIIAAMRRGVHHAGFRSIYFLNLAEKRAVSFKYGIANCNTLFGPGRIFSSAAVNSVDDLYPGEYNRSMDFLSEQELVRAGFAPVILKTEAPVMIDIKSEESITKWERFEKCKAVDYGEIIRTFGLCEI